MSRILHVVNIYFVLPYFIGDQFKYLNSKGFKQHVVCSPSEYLSEYSSQMGFNYEEIQILREINPVKDLKSVLAIIRYIKKNNIEIVVGHTPKGAFLAMVAAFISRVPKRIYFRHGLVFETMTGFKRWLMINLDRLTALCAHQVVNVSPSVSKESLRYKLNSEAKQLILGKGTCGGIDASGKFNPALIDIKKQSELRKELNISNGDFVIGFCGRLVRDKGIIELVDAYRKLEKNGTKKIKLLLVGDFEVRDALPLETQEFIKNHPDIILTGFVFKDIEYYYSLMDMFVLPSYREGFPTSILEASSMQMPVLTTKATGCIDAIIEGETGKFITHKSEDIFRVVTNLIESGKINEMGLNGRSFVLSHFDNQILWPIIEKELYRD